MTVRQSKQTHAYNIITGNVMSGDMVQLAKYLLSLQTQNHSSNTFSHADKLN